MRESFVIHSEYIEDLPEEYRMKFLMYIYCYGIREEVPQLKGLEQSLWIKIQRRIDSDKDSYNERKEYINLYNEYRKAIKSGTVDKSTSFESFKTFKTFKTFEKFENIPTDTSSVYVNDIVSVNVNDIVSVSDTVSDAPSTLTNSQTKYAKDIFNIFNAAGLPCSKGNELTFMQTDFKNAIAYIHNSTELKNFNSDAIIEACRNYVKVFEDTGCYITTKMNFYSLVKSKIFYNLLPGNFDIENFRNFQSKQSKKEDEQPAEKKVFSPKPCPKCGGKHIWWSNNAGKYLCDDCSGSFNFDEYLGDDML